MQKKEIFYKVADIVRAIGGKPSCRYTSAIIVAAGNSTRMGYGISKQMALLEGMPVVVRTLRAYQQCPDIDEIMDVAQVPLLGVIPEDEAVTLATANGKALDKKSYAATCFDNIAGRFCGNPVPLARLEKMV